MENLGLIEMVFSFGIVIAWAAWQLIRTPNPNAKDKEDAARKTPESGEKPPNE